MSAEISVSDKRLPSGPIAAGDSAVVSPLGAIVPAERAEELGSRLGRASCDLVLSAVEPASACTAGDVGSIAGFSGLSLSAEGLIGESVV